MVLSGLQHCQLTVVKTISFIVNSTIKALTVLFVNSPLSNFIVCILTVHCDRLVI